jgi:hypothetical protein
MNNCGNKKIKIHSVDDVVILKIVRRIICFFLSVTRPHNRENITHTSHQSYAE